MKWILIYFYAYLPLSFLSQNVLWVNTYNTSYGLARFYKNPDRIYLAGYSLMRIIHKNGQTDTVFSLAQNFVPYDFIKENSKLYFAGTSPGLTTYRISSNFLNGPVAWDHIHSSMPPYNQVSTYYPETRALSLLHNNNSIYFDGIYQDSMFLGNWLCCGAAVFSKVNSDSGTVLWSKTLPGGSIIVRNFKTNAFVLGSNITGNTSFGPFSININTNRAVVLAQIDTIGTFNQAKLIGEGIQVNDVRVDKHKNIYVAGSFNTNCKIGNILYPNSHGGMYILKTDSSANIQWTRIFYSKYYPWGDELSKLHVSEADEVYATGWFGSDTLKLQDTILIKNGHQRNAYLLKFSPVGQRLFSMNLSDVNDNIGYDITSDDDGAIYWSGALNGPASVGNYTLTGPAGFIIKFNDFSSPVSISKHYLNNFFHVYPNPADDYLSIEAPLGSKLTITDLYGNKLFSEVQKSRITQIPKGNLSKGIYFLILSGCGQQIKKIIIQ